MRIIHIYSEKLDTYINCSNISSIHIYSIQNGELFNVSVKLFDNKFEFILDSSQKLKLHTFLSSTTPCYLCLQNLCPKFM